MREERGKLRSDDYELPYRLRSPPGPPEPPLALVVCHGSTPKGMEHELVESLLHGLSSRWPVLALDLPGFGRAPRLVVREVDDYLLARHLLAAAELAGELTGLEVLLVGHSVGGRVSLQAARAGQEEGLVRGVVTLAGLYELPRDPGLMAALLADFARFVRVEFEVPMDELAREIAGLSPTKRAIGALEVPLLAVEAGRERYGFIRESRYGLFREARCPKTLVLLGSADHKFRDHHPTLVELVSSWLELRFGGGS